MTAPLDLAALRAAAEAVGDEQWTLYMGEEDPIAVVTYDPQPGRRKQVALHPLYPRDKAKAVQRTNYIAAAPPATVIALLDRLARAEEALRGLLDDDPTNGPRDFGEWFEGICKQARAALEPGA
jgi:hypothetical protein